MGLQRVGHNEKLSKNNSNKVSQSKKTRSSSSMGASPVTQMVENLPAMQTWLN